MRFTFGQPHICTYCGAPADTIDHTIPYSWFRTTGSDKRKQESVGFMTYACRECNSLLGSRIFPTFQKRLLWLNNRLREKHRKEMSVLWDAEDIASVSGRLKQYIQQQNRINLEQRARVSWIDSVQFQSILSKAQDELYYDTTIPEEFKKFLIDEDFIPSSGLPLAQGENASTTPLRDS